MKKMNSEHGNMKALLQIREERSINFPPIGRYQGDTWTPLLVLSAAVSILGFAVPAGYCLGALNTPVKILQNWCNITLIENRGAITSKIQFDFLWSLIVSVFLIGGVIGGLTGAWFADRMGRRGTLIFGNVLNTVSSVMFFSSKYFSSVELFFVARIIVGFTAGLMTAVIPMYLTELSPPKLTGIMGMMFPIGLTFGILITQILGLDYLLGTEQLWQYLLSAYFFLTVFVYVSLPWLPESPKFLCQIMKGDKALHELSRLRSLPPHTVAWEITSVSSSPRQLNQDKWNLIRVLSTPRLRIPLCLVVALQAGQQFSGISAVFYYSANIFEAAGLDSKSVQYAIIGTGLINFSVNACGLWLVNSFSRRKLLILSCSLTSLALVLFTFSSKYMNIAKWVPYASVTIMLIFVFVYNIGLGPIPYFIGAELVDIGPRPVVMALGSVANWGANFLIGVGFTNVKNLIEEMVFLCFSVSTLLLLTFIVAYLPESKGSKLHELTNDVEFVVDDA